MMHIMHLYFILLNLLFRTFVVLIDDGGHTLAGFILPTRDHPLLNFYFMVENFNLITIFLLLF